MKFVVVIAAAALFAAPAEAARQPRPTEVPNIRSAMLYELHIPARCLKLHIAVSTVDHRFAIAQPLWPRMMGGCARYRADGFDIVRDRGGLWSVVWRGSDFSRCVAAIPTTVVRDLVGTVCH